MSRISFRCCAWVAFISVTCPTYALEYNRCLVNLFGMPTNVSVLCDTRTGKYKTYTYINLNIKKKKKIWNAHNTIYHLFASKYFLRLALNILFKYLIYGNNQFQLKMFIVAFVLLSAETIYFCMYVYSIYTRMLTLK